MWAPGARVLQDVAAASWVARALRGEPGTVGGTVPDGYAAHARVLHPVRTEHGEPVTWAHVGAATGRTVHPVVQWHALVDSADRWHHDDSQWPQGQPEQGTLAPAPLAALCALLAVHTTTPDDCTVGIWEGWGWIGGGRRYLTTGGGAAVPSVFTARELAAPRLQLPGRGYVLVGGPLSAVTAISTYDDGLFGWQSPNLLWPADRAWFVGTEVDFDSTLVAGSAALVAAVLAHPGLEAWAVGPDDPLTWDGDGVNPTNPRALPPLRPPQGPLRRMRDRLRPHPGLDLAVEAARPRDE